MLVSQSQLFCDVSGTWTGWTSAGPCSGPQSRGDLSAALRVLRQSEVSVTPIVNRKKPAGLGKSCVCSQPNF